MCPQQLLHLELKAHHRHFEAWGTDAPDVTDALISALLLPPTPRTYVQMPKGFSLSWGKHGSIREFAKDGVLNLALVL